MLKSVFFCFALGFVAISAHAISRSGGGKLESVDLGFEAKAPTVYTRPNSMTDAGLRLWSDTLFGFSFEISAESFIELRNLQTEFPQLAQSDRVETGTAFSKIAWVRSAHSEACIDVYRRESKTVTATILVWGPGRGVVILGGVSVTAKTAIDEIVQTLRLSPGSCGW